MTDYTLIFDGGSRGNPGQGYGSYALVRNSDDSQRIRRLEFDGRLTNNEAEYMTLIAGLEDLIATIEEAGCDPAEFSVQVRGDSRLVLRQTAGEWKVRQPHLRPLCDRSAALLKRFGATELKWHARSNSVDVLGH